MRGSARIARAIDTRCFCPPESFTPRSPTMVSYFCSKCSANSSTRAMRQPRRISSSVAARPRKRHILANRPVEQKRLLQHHAKLRAVRIELDGRKIDTIHQTRARSRAHKTPRSSPIIVDLPAPDGPTSAVTVPGADSKIDVVQNFLALVVGEVHILHHHLAVDAPQRRRCAPRRSSSFFSFRISRVRSSPVIASVICVPIATI